MSIQSGTSPGAIISAGETPAGPPVTSVFGRIGAVVAVAGDYGSDEITNESGVAGATVSDALDTLAADIFVPGDPLFNVVVTAVPYVALVGDFVLTTDTSVTTPVAPADGAYFAVKNVGVLPVSIIGTVDGSVSYVIQPPNAVGQTATWFVWSAVNASWEIVSYYDPLASRTTLHLYVSSVNGSDANNGLSSAAPVQTTAGLARIFPRLRFAPVIVHFGSGSYTRMVLPPSTALAPNCPVYVMGDGASQPGDTGVTVVASGVVGAASTDLVINAAVASKDLYQGMTLRFTSGVLATAMRRHVRNNTTTTIVPDWRLNAVPAVADTFNIERSAVIFTYTDAYTFAEGIGFGQVDSPLVLVNIAFQGPVRAAVTPAMVVRIAKCHVVAYNVSTQTGGSVQFVESYCHAGVLYTWGSNQQRRLGNVPPLGNGTVTTVATLALADLGTDPFNYQGWGMSSPWVANLQTTPVLLDKSVFNGSICAGFFPVSAGSIAVLTGGGLVGNGLAGSGALTFESYSYGLIQGTSVQRLQMTGGGGQNAPGNPFWLDGATTVLDLQIGAFLEIGNLDAVSAAGASINAFVNSGTIYATNGNGGTGAITLTLTGAGSVGLLLRFGARFIQDGGTLTITFTSTPGNAIEVSSGGYITGLANFVTNGDIVLGSDGKIVGAISAVVTFTARRLLSNGCSVFDFSQNGSGTFTLNNGAAGNACTLDRGTRILLYNIVVAITGTVTLGGGSELQHGGAVGASVITASVTNVVNIAAGCKTNLLGATSGTLSITSTGAPAVGVRCQGDLLFNNARIAVAGAVSAIDFSLGGHVYSTGQPTNVVGGTNDFLDEQGGFADGLLGPQTCVFTGQHPAGAYSAVAPTGSGFVQRLS